MKNHKLQNQKPQKDGPSSFFVAATAVLLVSLGAGGVVGARALLRDRTPTKFNLGVDPSSSSSETETASLAPLARAPERERRGPLDAPAPHLPSGPDLRSPVQAASTARAAEVHDAASLDHLLTELEQTARSKGRVTAFEVEPGMAAIRALYSDDDAQLQRRLNEFGARMSKLSASYQPPPQPSLIAQQYNHDHPTQGETP